MEFVRQDYINLAYVAAGVLFILGLKGLTHPRTAVRGNQLGALGMLLAVVATLLRSDIGYGWILLGLVIGTVIGGILAAKIEMTAMPQLVALFNGFGGAASVLVAWAEIFRNHFLTAQMKGGVASTSGEILRTVRNAMDGKTTSQIQHVLPSEDVVTNVAIVLSGLIGAVTFWGSLVAFGKLQELDMFKKPFDLNGQQLIKIILAVATLILGACVVFFDGSGFFYLLLVISASALGILLVLPIGGADMPVVIALLNSYSGIAAAATGFVINNSVLIIAGSLVGASGLILTNIMCKAMNRSLTNVLFGVLQPGAETATADEVYEGKIKSTTADEVAMLYDSAERAIIVPGYGLAVAQAQHAVRELAEQLESRGIEVEFAIHPVAGRMPGHMNVLLAEAEISYDKLKEMDEINPTFAQTDVVLVVGANDVVNPMARTDPTSPIAGMPILNVDQAKTVVVIKRSLSPGFAGIPNPLFAADNCLMFFGDGKQAVLDLVTALKEA
ncbi:MAG TPA: NAD(P)(+) transhydrogenase (Re/Si-specific) subunit beta [Pirellulales bacterium]|nr:NAD(P)(+) transhydrogenase (Re/Si-specific) subunit beta [Pirellulales bacterium]